jgi:hypothetical protein
MKNWKDIWESRDIAMSGNYSLNELIEISGFDGRFSSINEKDWTRLTKRYIDWAIGGVLIK